MAQESETRKFEFNVETVTEKSKAHTRHSGKRKNNQKASIFELFQGLLKYRNTGTTKELRTENFTL